MQKDYQKPTNNLATSLSPAEGRAKRLKLARDLANLTREEMCKDELLNINTLTGWENAKYGGLTKNGAEKIITRLQKEGVICTSCWLMDGEGKAPYVDYDYLSFISKSNLPESETEEQIIARELALFKSNQPDTVSLKIEGEYMLPLYSPGDYVAGKKRFSEEINSLLGLNCIVETADGQFYVRNLKSGTSKSTYTLTCTNLEANDSTAIIFNTKLLSAAPITWHRKKEPPI